MKKSRKWLLRLFSLAVIFSVVFALAIPVSAERYNAGSFIESINEYGETAVINYRVPAKYSAVYVFDVDANYEVVYFGTGSYHDVGFIPGHMYRISICPLGYRAMDTGLIASTVPSSFNFQIGYGYLYENGDDTGFATIVQPSAELVVYSESSSTPIHMQSLHLNGQNGRTQIVSYNNPFTMPSNAYTLNFEFMWDNVSWESDPVPTGIFVDDFLMQCALPASLLDTYYWQWTNGMLGDIQDGFFGNYNPIDPPNAGDLDDLGRFEDELLEHIDGEIGSIENLLGGFGDVVFEIAPALLFVSWIIDVFASLSFFSKLINVVISLGITAFVLNLLITVISRSRTENNKSSEAHKDKKGG